jgi:hypothetical protein
VTELQASPRELAALATATRPDWDPDVLASAILAAKNAGWTWDRTLSEVIRLVRKPDGDPVELRNAARNPLRPVAGKTPAWHDRAAEARRLLEHRHEDGAA